MFSPNIARCNPLLKKTKSLRSDAGPGKFRPLSRGLDASIASNNSVSQKKVTFPWKDSKLRKKTSTTAKSGVRSITRSSTMIKINNKPVLSHSKSQRNLRIGESLNIHTKYSDDSEFEKQYRRHLGQMFRSLDFIKTLPNADPQILRQKRVDLPKKLGCENKKTIIFDLDETLIHCLEPGQDIPDIILRVPMPTGGTITTGIKVRPYAIECLKEAHKYFEIILFTASIKPYADAVLKHLDPSGEIIHHRLYRDNCIMLNGSYVKDLRILAGRKFQDIIIVDNAVHSFAYQLDNGVPIVSWINNAHDKELLYLMEYFPELNKARDMREVNRATFDMRQFYEDYYFHVNK